MTTSPLKDPKSVHWSIIDETSVHWSIIDELRVLLNLLGVDTSEGDMLSAQDILVYKCFPSIYAYK